MQHADHVPPAAADASRALANADWVPPAGATYSPLQPEPAAEEAAAAAAPRKRRLPFDAPLPARPHMPRRGPFSAAPPACGAFAAPAAEAARSALAFSLLRALERGRRAAAAAAAAALIPEARSVPLLVLEAGARLYGRAGGGLADAGARRGALLRLQRLLLDSETTVHGPSRPRVSLLPPVAAAALADALCGAVAPGAGAAGAGGGAPRGVGRPAATVAMALRMCAAARGVLLATLCFPGLPLAAAEAAAVGAALLRRPELQADPALHFLCGLACFLQWLQGQPGGAEACAAVGARLLAWRGGGGGAEAPPPAADWLPPPAAMQAADSLPGRNGALEARALAEAVRHLRGGVELLLQAAQRAVRRLALPAAVRANRRARVAVVTVALAPWLEPHRGLPLLLHRALCAAGLSEDAEKALLRYIGETTGASEATAQADSGAWWEEDSEAGGGDGGSASGSSSSSSGYRSSSSSGNSSSGDSSSGSSSSSVGSSDESGGDSSSGSGSRSGGTR
jgi:hypothetical protein